MENLIKFGLPIGAFVISMISLVFSFKNMRFTKRYESAKKRTELLFMVLDGITVLRAQKEQLLSLKELCRACPESRAEQICSDYDKLIESQGLTCEDIEKMTKITDPIMFEYALGRQGRLSKNIYSRSAEIDSFVKKCRECKRRPRGAVAGGPDK